MGVRILLLAMVIGLGLIACENPLDPSETEPAAVQLVDAGGSPIAEADVELHCSATDTVYPAATDGDGMLLAGSDILTACSEALILHPITQDANGRFTLYRASWLPGEEPVPVALDTNQTVTVATPFVTFHPRVSIAWNSTADYLDSLEDGLFQAAEFLFSATGGQATFGTVTLSDEAQDWETADIRILATNDMRPTAYIGGLLDPSESADAGAALTTTFRPGRIYLGRQWSPDGALDGDLWNAPDNARTIVHEWAHYALLLRDSYITADGTVSDCHTNTSASVMTNQFESNEFWSEEDHGTAAEAQCGDTPQWLIYEETDWGVLEKWGEAVGQPDWSLEDPTTNFIQLPFDTIGTVFNVERNTEPSGPSGRTVTVSLSPYESIQAQAGTYFAQVYTQSAGGVLHQGTIAGGIENLTPAGGEVALGQIDLVGVQDGDPVYVTVDVYFEDGTGVQFLAGELQDEDGSIAEAQGPEEVIVATQTDWQLTLDGTYALAPDGVIASAAWTVTSTSEITGVDWCTPNEGCQPTDLEGDGPWVASFSFGSDGMPSYGVLRIQSEAGTIMRWIRDGGGVGSAHVTGHTPLTDGELQATQGVDWDDSIAEGAQACTRMVVMAETDSDVVLGVPQRVEGRVHYLPLDVDFVEPEEGSCSSIFELESQLRLTLHLDRAWTDRTRLVDDTSLDLVIAPTGDHSTQINDRATVAAYPGTGPDLTRILSATIPGDSGADPRDGVVVFPISR